MDKKTAFVAMKFDNESWKDKRYMVIKEVLAEAGYNAIRADEIKTSGPSASEICELMKKSDLVVIDSTGDSHSVSYEIGYCHGIKRSYDTTILLRQDNGLELPFNFKHFRCRPYKDLGTLRRVLRSWFSMSTPINITEYGFIFRFATIKADGTRYGLNIAKAIVEVLRIVKFTGRSQAYAADYFGEDRGFGFGLGLKLNNNKTPDYKFWIVFRTHLIEILNTIEKGIEVYEDECEFSEIRTFNFHYIPMGVCEFENGIPIRVLDPDSASSDSWFIMQVYESMKKNEISF